MTDRLLTECTLELYEQLANINDCNHVFLIREKSTGLLFVKKVLAQYDEPIFATLKEAQIPGIPTIQHILRDGETLILIEDFVNGQTVQSLLQNGPLPEKLAIDILNQLTRILTSLHRRTPPVIHRDIKAS
nr:serine/threonine protein kinase [Eubacterium sp.]